MDDLFEFVITVPQPFGVELAHKTRTRTTLGVLVQLVASAQREIVLSFPFIQAERSLTGSPLAEALQAALGRDVQINILSTNQGIQSIKQVGWIAKADLRKIRLFQPKTNIEMENQLGSHAKFCIADSTAAYIGSANLTGPGLSEHLEMGFLVRGKYAEQVFEFWRFLVEKGFCIPVANSPEC